MLSPPTPTHISQISSLQEHTSSLASFRVSLPCLSEARALADRPPQWRMEAFSFNKSKALSSDMLTTPSLGREGPLQRLRPGERQRHPHPSHQPRHHSWPFHRGGVLPGEMVKSILLTKVHLVKAMVFPVAMYGYES